jgi:FdhD protein
MPSRLLERDCAVTKGSSVTAGIRIGDGLPAAADHMRSLAFRGPVAQERMRGVPEETPVALTFNGTTYAVMMATPADLTDFAIGFSLAEGVISGPADIESLEVVTHANGIELQMWLAPARAMALGERRRSLAGPTGCGLCGVESLAGVLPQIPRVEGGIAISPQTVFAALSSLASVQPLFHETRAVHAAGFFVPGKGFLSVREDVGRHNALDKLVGDLACRDIAGETGLVALTGRISIEMVQKTAALGASVIVAISAPTALAIRAAEAAGITLIAIAREDGFEIFTHPSRITPESAADAIAADRGTRGI